MNLWKPLVSLVVFFFPLCVHLAAECVSASKATKETKETYFKVLKRRLSLEQRDGTEDVCSEIVRPTWKNGPKQEESPCPNLTVWVPKKTGFTEFVDVDEHGILKGGFSIAVFCYAIQLLPFEVQPIFIPFINDNGGNNGYYDELIQQIEGKTCEAMAGDVTIQQNRSKHVDFTIAYMSSEVYMLVPAIEEWKQTVLTLFRPFTLRLWLMTIGACIFVGTAIGILEYRAGNLEFVIPFYQKLVMIIWFPITTFFFSEGKILNRCSKVVLVMWLSMIFLVLQIYTASLSSWLTINHPNPKLPTQFESVGYHDGSFVKHVAIANSNCNGDKLQNFSSVEQFKYALDHGTVNAIFDELPYIELFLAKYGSSNYTKSKLVAREPGFAFAFPRGSSLAQRFSTSIMNTIESQCMTYLEEKYLGISTNVQQEVQALPQSLDAHSFTPLFIFMGTVTILAIMWSEISLTGRHGQ